MSDIFNLYRFHRSTYPARPAIALQRARDDQAKGTKRYGGDKFWHGRKSVGRFGAAFDGGLHWTESAADIGFRFVGFADEIAKREGYWRAIDHTGWYTDSDMLDNVCRGAVYQLPARKGKPRYHAGYREGYESNRGKGWQDSAYTSDHGAAVIDMSKSYESPWEAARAADGLAESAAKEQREYNDAWQAANQWQELGRDMLATRGHARKLVSDMRAAIRSGIQAAPSICDALRAQLRSLMGDWEEMRAKREELADNFYYWEGGKRISISEFAL